MYQCVSSYQIKDTVYEHFSAKSETEKDILKAFCQKIVKMLEVIVLRFLHQHCDHTNA